MTLTQVNNGDEPALRDALVQALRDRLGEGFTVQISVNEGRRPDSPKPRVALFGVTFWPDIVVLRGREPILGVEVKHIREGHSPTHAIAETIGQSLIYRLLYPRVIAFVLRDGLAEPKPLENEARLREIVAGCRIDLVMRCRAAPRSTGEARASRRV